jgi:hypothetical protein
LPVLVALYRSADDNRRAGRAHKTPAQLMELLLWLLLRWFPERSFVFAGDTGYGTHALAAFAQRQGGRLTLVSGFRSDANLYESPPVVVGKRPNGRPRKKVAKLPKPAAVVAAAERTRLNVAWYGGGRQWYQAGQDLVAVRWVYVHDLTGTHRDQYYYSTETMLTAQAIIEEYTGRWNIETTFQELRAHLGLETTRGRCRATVLRAEPLLFGLYSLVALLYGRLPAEAQAEGGVEWEGKQAVTFSDALSAVS